MINNNQWTGEYVECTLSLTYRSKPPGINKQHRKAVLPNCHEAYQMTR